MSEANKELVRRHFQEIWNQRQLDVCDEIMADSYVEHARAPFGTTEPGAVVGPQAMRETVQWLLAQFTDITMTIEAMAADGDTAAVRVLSRIEDGKLAEHWATRDDLTAMLQLGVVKQPGPPKIVAMIQGLAGRRSGT
jgi:predicted SnoaL-like aldol condensation-catalyzing enzyme